MPLKNRAPKIWKDFSFGVSYKVNETQDRFRDALNVYSNQKRLDTRPGMSRFNATSLGGKILSCSFFVSSNGTQFRIVKVGTVLYSVNATGAHTVLKTGLSSTTKHRGKTFARGSSTRHIISVEDDGLFQFDGTTFTVLGQDPPTAATVATTVGSLPNSTYRVAITYYSSSTGFESNASYSATVATVGQGINVTAIPTTATNATIDQIRVYLEDFSAGDAALLSTTLSLGTASTTITSLPTSSFTPPLANAKPLIGGGKFLVEFNRSLVYAGNSNFKNDVFFSEQDLPDAFNDGNAPNRIVLYASGIGDITGLAVGLFSDSVVDPYLVIFKRKAIHVYSEINGQSQIQISSEIGCVSHETIIVKNGNVYFLSEQGWHAIYNGRLVVDSDGDTVTLGGNDIDDIFKSPGFVYEVNQSQLANAFSVFYPRLEHYLTWIPEGQNTSFSKTYNYEFETKGFKPYEFFVAGTCAMIGEDASGDVVVYFGDSTGYLYSHSVKEDKRDVDATGTEKDIQAFAQLTWQDGDDLDSSFNFRELMIRALASEGTLTIKTWIDYNLQTSEELDYLFTDPGSGFILDMSELDVDVLSDGRTIVKSRGDINRCSTNILIGFYQIGQDLNMGLVKAQLDFSKNGNPN
jgi:hypothetical protein